MKFRELVEELYNYAPIELSQKFIERGGYDNSGIIIDTTKDVKSVLFCLDLTNKSVENALQNNCEAIVTHHPAIYRPIKNLSAKSPLLTAANCGLGVVSTHLNLDAAKYGIDYCLAKGLGGKIVKITDDFGGGKGYGRISEINCRFAELIENYKTTFGSDKVFAYGDLSGEVRKVASFCGAGLGDEEVEIAINERADTVVSADIPHHILLRCVENGLKVMACTHYATENYGMKIYSDKMREKLKNVKIYFFDDDRFI